MPSAAGPDQEQHGQEQRGRERQADDLSSCKSRNYERAKHVSGERGSRQASTEAEDEGRSSDELERSDRRHEQIGRRQAVGLKRCELSAVIEELAGAERDEDPARDQAGGKRDRGGAALFRPRQQELDQRAPARRTSRRAVSI